ncbi:MAG: hypothetical protein ACOZEN_15485 [Thermodesulfobacteriota bacterium]
MSPSQSVFLVNVPGLHHESSDKAPSGVRHLNPGLPAAESGVYFTPAGLPMAPPVVKAMLAQFAQLARESRSVADISAFAAGQYNDFYSGGSHAIKDELEAARSGRQKDIERAKALSRAQTELCLAWALEEYSLELAGLDDKLKSQWDTFSKNLGLDEEDVQDEDQAALAGARPSLVPDAPRVPFAVLVDAVLAFLPSGCGLYCAGKAILADWEEYGVSFSEASPETLSRFGLSGSFREAQAPGHLLCLARRPDPSRPWLDEPRIVLAPAEA